MNGLVALLEEEKVFLSPEMNARMLMKLLNVDRRSLMEMFLKEYGRGPESTLSRMRLSYARRLLLDYGLSFDTAVRISGFSSGRSAKKALAALDY